MTISSRSIAPALISGSSGSCAHVVKQPGIGEQPAGLDLAAIDFRQAVHGLSLQLRRLVLMAIPARIGSHVPQPEIGRQVDHPGGRGLSNQLANHVLRRAMRERAEHEIEPERRPVEAVQGQKLRQRKGRELRKNLAYLVTGAPVRRQQRDIRLRMAQQQPYAFRPGIAGRA